VRLRSTDSIRAHRLGHELVPPPGWSNVGDLVGLELVGAPSRRRKLFRGGCFNKSCKTLGKIRQLLGERKAEQKRTSLEGTFERFH